MLLVASTRTPAAASLFVTGPAPVMASSKLAAAAGAIASAASAQPVVWLPSAGTMVQLCGRLAPAASTLLFLAPLPTLLELAKTSSKQRQRGSSATAAGSSSESTSLPLLPYSSMVCNAALWVSYGVLKREPRIWSANAVGLALGAFYVATYLRCSPPPGGNRGSSSSAASDRALSRDPPRTTARRYDAHLQAMALAGAAAGILAFLSRPEWIGRVAVGVCVLMFASPLASAKRVVRTRNADSIPLPFTIASLVNCGLWTVSGALDMKDPAVVVPNALGLASGTLQLLLKFLYSPKRNGADPRLDGSRSLAPPAVPPL